MLLGSTKSPEIHARQGAFISELIGQQRYAEAYLLLKREPQHETSTQYNLALCFYQIGNYNDAVTCLDKAFAGLAPQPANRSVQVDYVYDALRTQQNQTHDHLKAVSDKYVSEFNPQVKDNIVRLKTDCWVQLGNWAKVIEVATPIANKNYRNIAEALATARSK